MSMMLAPPSHRRSCITCATAKRRCDLRLPQCSRCLSRATACLYSNEPLSSPSNVRPRGSSPPKITSGNGWKTPLDLPSDDLLSDIDFASFLAPEIIDQWSLSTTSSLPKPISPPATQVSVSHNKDSMAFLINSVRRFPAMFMFQGRTPFIHSRLYHGGLPKMMQDAFAICAVYMTMTENNKLTVFHIIEAKMAELIHESDEASWSIAENLAGVQALILVQIIQLFDGDIRQRHIAEQNEVILVRWTDQLHMRTENELISSTLSVRPSWIFAESIRRSIIGSHIIRGLYSCIKLGFCDNIASMGPLLFTAQAPQWDSPVGSTWPLVEQSSSPPLVSYYDFVSMSDKRRPAHAEAFERLLLVACKGEERVDILEPLWLS